MIPDDETILSLLWEPLPAEEHASNEDYVFMSVDVIGHSKLFANKMKKPQLLERHNLLLDLRTYVRECFQKPCDDSIGLEWDWAGDGGIYAYPTRKATLYVEDKTFLVAQRIATGLADFNQDKNRDDYDHIRQPSLFDSSIDRMARFMESWFRYFESQIASLGPHEPTDRVHTR